MPSAQLKQLLAQTGGGASSSDSQRTAPLAAPLAFPPAVPPTVAEDAEGGAWGPDLSVQALSLNGSALPCREGILPQVERERELEGLQKQLAAKSETLQLLQRWGDDKVEQKKVRRIPCIECAWG